MSIKSDQSWIWRRLGGMPVDFTEPRSSVPYSFDSVLKGQNQIVNVKRVVVPPSAETNSLSVSSVRQAGSAGSRDRSDSLSPLKYSSSFQARTTSNLDMFISFFVLVKMATRAYGLVRSVPAEMRKNVSGEVAASGHARQVDEVAPGSVNVRAPGTAVRV